MITAASLTFSDGSWWMTGGMKKDTASDLHSKPSTKTTFFDKVIKNQSVECIDSESLNLNIIGEVTQYTVWYSEKATKLEGIYLS